MKKKDAESKEEDAMQREDREVLSIQVHEVLPKADRGRTQEALAEEELQLPQDRPVQAMRDGILLTLQEDILQAHQEGILHRMEEILLTEEQTKESVIK